MDKLQGLPARAPARAGGDPDHRVTHLQNALTALGLMGEVTNRGTWLTVQGDRCLIYVVETNARTYLTWCGSPGEHTVELYHTPKAAIQAGLRRAAYAR